jgi:predicted nucleic acid-binding protein
VSFALDTNILLYASDSGSPHHERARSFLEECMRQEELFCLGWPTVMGLSEDTNIPLFSPSLTPGEAMANIGTLLNLPHTRFLSEEEGSGTYIKMTAESRPVAPSCLTHLAAILPAW